MSESLSGLHLEDARNLQDYLQSLAGDSEVAIDAVITSPPYADMKDYGGDGQIGQQPFDRFLEDCREVFRQCYEVTADHATLWMVVDEYQRNGRVIRLPSDLADVLENLPGIKNCDDCKTLLHHQRNTGHYVCPECGQEHTPIEESWQLKEHIIWDKKRTLPWAGGGLRNVHEHILVFGKSDQYKFSLDQIRIFDTDELSKWWVGYPERFNPKGKIPGNIWEHEIPKQGQWGPKVSTHPSPLPYSLIERIIRASTDKGDSVLDPFAGVGTTLAVADVLGREGIGFEINEEYLDVYNEYIRHDAREKLSQDPKGRKGQLEDTRRKIWTLRAHKYGFKLCKGLREVHEVDSVGTLGVNTIFAIINEDTLPPEDRESPKVTYVFALDGDATIQDVGKVQEAADHIQGGGSGGYFGLDAEFETVLSGQLLTDIRNNDWLLESESPLYVYIGPHHHWCVRETSVDGWLRDYGTQKWAQFTRNGYPPLLSTEHIEVEDESKSSGPPEIEFDDHSITEFADQLD